MEDVIVARYLFEQRPDGRYMPKVSVDLPGGPGGESRRHIITDPEGRTYRDLNRALESDFWLLNRWRAKQAPNLPAVIEIVGL
jgi:hypothetical protein